MFDSPIEAIDRNEMEFVDADILLDLFDTDDSENFKYQVTTATNAFMGALNQAGIIAGKYWPNVRKGVRADDSDLLDVFAGKVKHKPRFFE